MPVINKTDKTITCRTKPEREAKARVVLQELLDENPGYTPILIIKGPPGQEKTYTRLSEPKAGKLEVGKLAKRLTGLFRG